MHKRIEEVGKLIVFLLVCIGFPTVLKWLA